jgi:DNA repair exonuclease SbcCD ATPase subunit
MKTRLVLWGTDSESKKVMLAIALRATDNKVDVWAFPEEAATESFYQRMIDEWRFGNDLPFPETFTLYEVPFTTSGEFLPEGLKADRSDLMQQAQTEWQFVILSGRLYESYRDELQFFKDKLDRLDGFDQKVWEELKGFWEKVQSQIRERVLFRDHATQLRETTNKLFEDMKVKRRALDAEFKTISKEATDKFMTALDEIETRIKEDRGLQPIFEELKKLQREYHDTKFVRDDRNKVWKRLDTAFKATKEKRFGPNTGKAPSASGRLERRLEGLITAIGKMQKSISHDQRDIDFEQGRIEDTHGQLEAQIRQAKLAMIEERIKSKQEKLADMLKTQTEIEQKIAKEKKREEARKEKEEREKLRQQAKESVKEKIAEEIKHNVEAHQDEAEKLAKAAEEIVEAKKKPRRSKKESLASAVGETLGESLEDFSTTVKAVAEVVKDQIVDLFDGEEE